MFAGQRYKDGTSFSGKDLLRTKFHLLMQKVRILFLNSSHHFYHKNGFQFSFAYRNRDSMHIFHIRIQADNHVLPLRHIRRTDFVTYILEYTDVHVGVHQNKIHKTVILLSKKE